MLLRNLLVSSSLLWWAGVGNDRLSAVCELLMVKFTPTGLLSSCITILNLQEVGQQKSTSVID